MTAHRRALWEVEVALSTEILIGARRDGVAVSDGPEQHVQPRLQLLLALGHTCLQKTQLMGHEMSAVILLTWVSEPALDAEPSSAWQSEQALQRGEIGDRCEHIC